MWLRYRGNKERTLGGYDWLPGQGRDLPDDLAVKLRQEAPAAFAVEERPPVRTGLHIPGYRVHS